MATYYEILGIPENADSTAIRVAYKRLAMIHHPDRNPGNQEAEEQFKIVNEAYHVLSDPLKRSRYDSRFQMSETVPKTSYRDMQRARYQYWRATQRYRYRFDRQYFRIQGLAFLVFLLIAGFCFGVIHTIEYFGALHYKEIKRQNMELLQQVDKLFDQGKVDEAFEMISLLRDKDPHEYRFLFAHDSLVRVLRNQGDDNYEKDNYQTASYFYGFLKKYELPLRMETLRRIAVCDYQQGAYQEAIQSMKELYANQPWDYNLVYNIATIELNELNNPVTALHFFDEGKRLFKENMSHIYGKAFQVVMNPADAPDVYFNIFMGRGQANMKLKNYEEAVTDYNFATWLRPENPDPFRERAIAKANAGQPRGLCDDLARAKKLGATDIDPLLRRYCH